MINIKYCRKCGKAFDIATNNDVCKNCRMKKRGKSNANKKRK